MTDGPVPGTSVARRGRDPWTGGACELTVADERPVPMPGSALRTVRVQLPDGPQRLVRSLPGGAGVAAERALDGEIRALVRVARRYRVGADGAGQPPGLPRIVAYDVDGADPFVAVDPYRGVPAREAVPDMIRGDQRQRFAAGVFAALAELAAADLVHGAVGLDVLRVDPGAERSVQLVTFERTVATGEPRHGDGRPAHPGDDVRDAVALLAVAFGGVAPDRVGPDDLRGLDWLAEAAGEAFAAAPRDRPSAAEVLRRLPSPVSIERPRADTTGLDAARRRFDEERGMVVAPPRPAAVAAPAPRVRPVRDPAPPPPRHRGGTGILWTVGLLCAAVAVALLLIVVLQVTAS